MTRSASFSWHGSGDLLADRRYSYAEAALADGDAEAARDLFIQTLERVPDWLPARIGLGKACLALHDRDAAIAAFRGVAEQDEHDILGSRAFLAQIGAEGGALTPGYVAALFDDYAPRFDAHLTTALDYRAPEALADALTQVSGARSFHRALDLGCGTGLMARALEGRYRQMIGVDLSERMLDIACGTGLYAHLEAADCASWLASEATDSADLILAADVFCYIENLAPVFREARCVLARDGLFAFTIQTNQGAGMRVGSDLRVHHNPALIHDLAQASGFHLRHERAESVRKDRGQPVPGAVFVLSRSGEGS